MDINKILDSSPYFAVLMSDMIDRCELSLFIGEWLGIKAMCIYFVTNRLPKEYQIKLLIKLLDYWIILKDDKRYKKLKL